MPASDTALECTRIAALAADDVKATDIVAFDVTGVFPLADAFVVATGASERQVTAIAERVEEHLREHGRTAVRREGVREGRWALLDFNEIIVHVMHAEERDYYDLERLWKDCDDIPWREAS